jgi:hypothetical protein
MTNLHDDNQNNFVKFLQQNQPIAPKAYPNLEQQIFNSLELRTDKSKKCYKTWWAIPGAIATGFLFTSISFSLKTPRIAIESEDLETFLVKNWQNTLNTNIDTTVEETDAYWLLLSPSQSEPALSSAQ